MKVTIKKGPVVELNRVFLGVLWAFLLTFFLLLILSVFIYFSSFPEDLISKSIVIVIAFSIAVSSFLVSRNIEANGWLNGGLIGLIYSLMLLMVKIVFLKEGFAFASLIDVVFGFLIGAISGAIGVNL